MYRLTSLFRKRVLRTIQREQFSISTLSDGLRVITCDDFSGVMGIGFFSLNAAKFETENDLGSAAIFESMPLRQNELMAHEEVSQALGDLGNAMRVINNKEAMAVLLMTPAYHCKEALGLLNAMVLHPSQDPAVFEESKERTLSRSQLSMRDGMGVCLEMLHDAGWNGKGLGNPLVPSSEMLEKLSLERFLDFYARNTTPERSVIAATGVADHQAFVEQVADTMSFEALTRYRKKRGMIKEESAPSKDASSSSSKSTSSSSGLLGVVDTAPYTGGYRICKNVEPLESMSKFQEKNLSHVALFFKGVPLSHPDYYTLSVMQTLLGGGMSFSSGGPGKGMYTKIYREVLTREAGVHGMECITAWYSDGGLIGLYASSQHEHVGRLVEVMLHQSLTIGERITDYHLQMAKNQMLSQLVLLGENREQLLTDMGLNLLVHDYTITREGTIAGASLVTMENLQRVSKEILKAPPSFAAYGCTDNVPTFDQLQAVIQKKLKKEKKK